MKVAIGLSCGGSLLDESRPSPILHLFGDIAVRIDVRDFVSVQELLQGDGDDLRHGVSVFAGERVETLGGLHQDSGVEGLFGRATLRPRGR